jgi:HlyD family secretion protein
LISRRKRLIVIFGTLPLAVAAALVGGCKGSAPEASDAAPKPEVQVQLAAVERKTLRDLLPVTGTLSPLLDHESKVSPLTPGRVVKTFVKPGDQVVRGQVLAELDPGPLNGQTTQAAAAVQTARETLKQAQLNYSVQIKTQRSGVELARQNLETQIVALDKLMAGARPQEVAQAQANVNAAQAAMTNAEQNLSRSRTLFAEGLLARKDLEAGEAAQASAEAALRGAQEALSLTKAGNRPQDIEAGRVAVRQAQEQLKAAQDSITMNGVKRQDVEIAERQLLAAQGALTAAHAQLGAMTIRAPVSGTVEGRSLNLGEWVDTTGSVCTIADLTRVRLLLSVPEGQIADVRFGQTVEFTTNTDPTQTRIATVSVIGHSVDPATNTVTVEAIAMNGDRKLRDDGFVKGSLVIARHDNVLTVPSASVVDKDGQSTVYTVDDKNVAHETKVKTGLTDNGMVEVSRVKAGDKVVSEGAFELDDGTQVKPPEKEKDKGEGSSKDE